MIGKYILLLTLIAIQFSCSNSPTERNLAEAENKVSNDSELCQKVIGKWVAFRLSKGKKEKDCSQYPCREPLGPIIFICSDNQIVGKALLGISSGEKPPKENWTEISAEFMNSNLFITYMDEGCKMKYKIYEFGEKRLYGEVSSENCKILNKEHSYEGDLLLLKTE